MPENNVLDILGNDPEIAALVEGLVTAMVPPRPWGENDPEIAGSVYQRVYGPFYRVYNEIVKNKDESFSHIVGNELLDTTRVTLPDGKTAYLDGEISLDILQKNVTDFIESQGGKVDEDTVRRIKSLYVEEGTMIFHVKLPEGKVRKLFIIYDGPVSDPRELLLAPSQQLYGLPLSMFQEQVTPSDIAEIELWQKLWSCYFRQYEQDFIPKGSERFDSDVIQQYIRLIRDGAGVIISMILRAEFMGRDELINLYNFYSQLLAARFMQYPRGVDSVFITPLVEYIVDEAPGIIDSYQNSDREEQTLLQIIAQVLQAALPDLDEYLKLINDLSDGNLARRLDNASSDEEFTSRLTLLEQTLFSARNTFLLDNFVSVGLSYDLSSLDETKCEELFEIGEEFKVREFLKEIQLIVEMQAPFVTPMAIIKSFITFYRKRKDYLEEFIKGAREQSSLVAEHVQRIFIEGKGGYLGFDQKIEILGALKDKIIHRAADLHHAHYEELNRQRVLGHTVDIPPLEVRFPRAR